MTLIEKKWFFRIGPDLKPDGSFQRYQYDTWEKAKAEALERGGLAEEEMIEVEETTVTLPDSTQVTNRATTGRRAYRYADDKGEKPVKEYTLGGDYYSERARQEAALKAARSPR